MTRATRALALLLAAAALGCHTPAALPIGPPLGGYGRRAPIIPDDLDHAAAHLAVATLAGEPGPVTESLDALERAEAQHRQEDAGPPTCLVPAGIEAADAVLAPGLAGREATKRLLERKDVDVASRERLERWLADDPLELASKRIGDARFTAFARLFNTVAEPVGRSILNSFALPYSLGHALARYSVDFVQEDPLPLQYRQALAHWQDFRRRHPDSPEVVKLAPRIESYEAALRATRQRRALALTKNALREGRPDAALFYARRALRYGESKEADEAVAEADERIDKRRMALASAMLFAPDAPAPPSAGEREAVLAALIDPSAPVPDAAPGAPLAAELAFRRATVEGRDGDLDGMWQAFTAIHEKDAVPMARHAAAELRDPGRHPYGAFVATRSAERWRTTSWVLLGPLAVRPRAEVWSAAEYLLDLPWRIQGAALLPIRLLQLPWRDRTPGDAEVAVHARRYLAIQPDGAHAPEVRKWLLDFERDRENWVGALRVAESDPEAPDVELDDLRERAAAQALRVATAEQRSDLRAALLTNVARLFPETRAGRDAGRAAREQAIEHKPHSVRLSREFLLENPQLAGPAGLDLAPELLDGDVRNGELHPDGVSLVGGRNVVVAVLEPSGDDDDPPELLDARLSAEQLGRFVAHLEETSFRNALLDVDDAIEPDPQRDVLFERARLGLADDVDERPIAEANYAYRGMRERYGMVRSREPWLPVELVVQGSFQDLTLGAFPRLRAPRETPDAVLYRE